MTNQAARTPGERGTINVTVNGRRLTTSLARQLDEVPPNQLEPWGRINLGTAQAECLSVVGVELGTGHLVRSRVPGPRTEVYATSNSRAINSLGHYAGLTRAELNRLHERWRQLPLILL